MSRSEQSEFKVDNFNPKFFLVIKILLQVWGSKMLSVYFSNTKVKYIKLPILRGRGCIPTVLGVEKSGPSFLTSVPSFIPGPHPPFHLVFPIVRRSRFVLFVGEFWGDSMNFFNRDRPENRDIVFGVSPARLVEPMGAKFSSLTPWASMLSPPLADRDRERDLNRMLKIFADFQNWKLRIFSCNTF